jgi:hypothetical protein
MASTFIPAELPAAACFATCGTAAGPRRSWPTAGIVVDPMPGNHPAVGRVRPSWRAIAAVFRIDDEFRKLQIDRNPLPGIRPQTG